ncbi:pyrroline-5-carboxylate reductase dimerization-domain-containing protein [Aspergillus tamarii]|uniref:Pyrroline-5-carboxylate reductase dimerization-domain-containing protein n=1 Tax=Aspergillus tamarii TaxID=41984 RepID=A0A5N6UDJ8_ASPTM|nr:pyrroline-5-carboxylate reductase dimerization-domain-containing protein [Aspergillus tamarii]
MGINAQLTVAVIGCGTLGTAITAGILDPKERTDLGVKHITATVGTEPSKRRVENTLSQHSSRLTVLTQEENVRAVQAADVVLLAMKPVKRADVFAAPGFKEALQGKLVLSIMAGITTKALSSLALGEDSASNSGSALQCVRAMPNMAAKIREAVTLYTAGPGTTKENLGIASWVFSQVGEAHIIPESSFDICAVLVGCAGSLLLLAIDGLLDAAVAEGVKRPDMQNLVVNSAIGMMKLVPAGDHPSVLREKIASPGGCSIRALLELEKLGVRSAFTTAIMAAAEKSKRHIGKALLGVLLPWVARPGSPISEVTVALRRKESEARIRDLFRNSQAPVNFLSCQNINAVKNADAVLFAFPPEQVHDVLGTVEMREALRGKILISILARTPRDELKRLIGGNDKAEGLETKDIRLVRAMPTIGTEIHESATLIGELSSPVEKEAMELAMWIFNLVGKVFKVSHDYFDTATGMSAFCNALTTVAIQTITRKAIAEGIPVENAIAIASQCVRGTVSMVLSGTSPEKLEHSLSAPGSITGQAISGLRDSQLPALLESSLAAAITKAKS